MDESSLSSSQNLEQSEVIQEMPEAFGMHLEEEISMAGGEWQESEVFEGAVGRTMFDTPTSKDNTVTVLLPPDQIGQVPSQSLVRVKSRPMEDGGDGRQYLGIVVEGPFAEPDGLRADAPIVVTTTVRGATFMPRYHGRVQVEILGEEIDGTLEPPRFRPLPNSPVFALDQAETEEKLRLFGDVRIGLAVGYEEMPVALPTGRKDVFPRHMGILGTTGGGKSTTVSGLITKLSQRGVATVVFDTEGEYTHIVEPTQDNRMLAALQRRGLIPEGAAEVDIYRLKGRETTNPEYARNREFCLEFCSLSPYAVMQILELNDAQQERFLKAYDITKQALMQLGIYPASNEEKTELLELDEMERGYPRMTLQHMYDVVRLCADTVAGESDTYLRTKEFHRSRERITGLIASAQIPSHVWSWRKVQGSLSRLLRLGIFDDSQVGLPDYEVMTRPDRVTIIDLNDTDSPQINNLVISEILRGARLQQERNYKVSEESGESIRKVVIIIEEAHEFLSAERIRQMPVIFQQVARIARRGRKRWLGLIFVTQLPQHLPDEVLGLINNYVLHKIADANVIARLKRSIGGIDPSLWDRLPNLAPGQAIVSAASMARPLLVSIDPTPCKLRMIE
jgi:DNA helicase HerA-like ATPase